MKINVKKRGKKIEILFKEMIKLISDLKEGSPVQQYLEAVNMEFVVEAPLVPASEYNPSIIPMRHIHIDPSFFPCLLKKPQTTSTICPVCFERIDENRIEFDPIMMYLMKHLSEFNLTYNLLYRKNGQI
jgi:hypothetical protein